MEEAGIRHHREVTVPVVYRGRSIGKHRVDLIVDDLIVVELKAVERMDPLFEAQIIAYLRLTRKRVGLLLNFNSALLKSGIRRFVV
jgi:GxxExxY protein